MHIFPLGMASDEAVIAQAREIWWIFALLMPANGAAFALDGILIGAGDTRFAFVANGGREDAALQRAAP